MQTTILIWIGVMSLWAFVVMGYDKSQAKKRASRIPEKTIWLLAVLGGAIGAYFGMQSFRHKTRHTSFRVGLLVLALIYVCLILYLMGVPLPNTDSNKLHIN